MVEQFGLLVGGLSKEEAGFSLDGRYSTASVENFPTILQNNFNHTDDGHSLSSSLKFDKNISNLNVNPPTNEQIFQNLLPQLVLKEKILTDSENVSFEEPAKNSLHHVALFSDSLGEYKPDLNKNKTLKATEQAVQVPLFESKNKEMMVRIDGNPIQQAQQAFSVDLLIGNNPIDLSPKRVSGQVFKLDAERINSQSKIINQDESVELSSLTLFLSTIVSATGDLAQNSQEQTLSKVVANQSVEVTSAPFLLEGKKNGVGNKTFFPINPSVKVISDHSVKVTPDSLIVEKKDAKTGGEVFNEWSSPAGAAFGQSVESILSEKKETEELLPINPLARILSIPNVETSSERLTVEKRGLEIIDEVFSEEVLPINSAIRAVTNQDIGVVSNSLKVESKDVEIAAKAFNNESLSINPAARDVLRQSVEATANTLTAENKDIEIVDEDFNEKNLPINSTISVVRNEENVSTSIKGELLFDKTVESKQQIENEQQVMMGFFQQVAELENKSYVFGEKEPRVAIALNVNVSNQSSILNQQTTQLGSMANTVQTMPAKEFGSSFNQGQQSSQQQDSHFQQAPSLAQIKATQEQQKIASEFKMALTEVEKKERVLGDLGVGLDRRTELPVAMQSIATNARSPKWGQELGKRLTYMVNKNIQEAKITLSPGNLGAIQIKIKVDKDQQVNISMLVQHGTTRELLENALPKLKDILESSNVNLVNVDIGSGSQFKQDGKHLNKESNQFKENNFVADKNESSTRVIQSSDNLIDYYV